MAIGFLNTLANVGISHAFNAAERDANVSAQKDLAVFNKNLNMQMLRESPKTTVEGLRDAGLSPLSSQGNFTDVPSNGVPSISQPSGAPQIDPLTESAIVKNLADADNAKADAEGKEIDNNTKDEINRATLDNLYKDIGLKDSQIDEISAKVDWYNQSIQESVSKIALNEQQVKRLAEQTELDVWNTLIKQDEIQAKIKELESQMHLNNAEATEIMHKIAVGFYTAQVDAYHASAAASRSQVGLNQALAGKAKAETGLAIAETGRAVAETGKINAETAVVKQQGIQETLKSIYMKKTNQGRINAENNANAVNGSKFTLWMDKGLNWASTATDVVGRGVAMYATGGMSEAFKSNANSNARNATTNEERLNFEKSKYYNDNSSYGYQSAAEPPHYNNQ